MNDLVLHAKTKSELESFVNTPAHALLLTGPTGSGKMHLAERVSETILNLAAGKLKDYPYATVISLEKDKKLIAIEAIRGLEQFLALKVPSQKTIDRVVIIEDSHLLSIEAQNALLKTLEEPPADTVLILTASHEQALLPTIRSRVRTLPTSRPRRDAVMVHFVAKGFTEETVKQAYSISGGLPGLMTALLSDEEHPLKQATQRARQLLSQTAYDRLLVVDELSKQRQLAIDTAFILQQMAHVSLQTADDVAAKKWQAVMTASYEAAEALQNSAQPKLVLSKLMLSL